MKPEELPDWIGQRMASRGLKPDRAAIEALAERVEGNSLAAAQEIDKLALLHGSKPLDADTLEALVTDSARFDVFKLVDAALEGDGARTVRILHGLRAEGEQVPALMGWVLNQLQMIARHRRRIRTSRPHSATNASGRRASASTTGAVARGPHSIGKNVSCRPRAWID